MGRPAFCLEKPSQFFAFGFIHMTIVFSQGAQSHKLLTSVCNTYLGGGVRKGRNRKKKKGGGGGAGFERVGYFVSTIGS